MKNVGFRFPVNKKCIASNYTKKRKATLASSIMFNSFNKTPGTIKTSGRNCVVMITQEFESLINYTIG